MEDEHARMRAALMSSAGDLDAEITVPAPLAKPESWSDTDFQKAQKAAETDRQVMWHGLKKVRDRRISRSTQCNASGIEGGRPQPVVRRKKAAGGGRPAVAERVEKMLGRLNREIEPSPEIEALAQQVVAAPVARQPVLLGSLRDRVEEHNASVKRTRSAVALLEEARLLAEESADAELAAEVRTFAAAPEAGLEVDVAGLKQAVAAAQARQLVLREQEYAYSALAKAYGALGYEVLESPEVLTVSGGVLFRHRSGPSHGMVAVVKEGSIRLEPVRLAVPGAPPVLNREAADIAADEELCRDTTKALQVLPGQQVSVQGAKPGRAGVFSLRVVPLAAEEVVPVDSTIEVDEPVAREMNR
ncbi:hypothetical protein [Kutzneria chonburiensis]|uniref:Uncharacterized protein n=1 Tax=Kutzneria chonburiensis TaxID=1483604 RepID=A0ABV6MNS1_9PSEU|nr:hypothetical protein [Kutzneria chonburiensis]